MLLYKKGKFHIGGAAFTLPDDVYLLWDQSDCDGETCLELQSTDHACRIVITGEASRLSGWQYFQSPDFDVYRKKSKITEICRNGVKGYCMLYESRMEKYAEYRFEIPSQQPSARLDTLSVLIFTQSENDLATLLERPEVITLLDSVECAA